MKELPAMKLYKECLECGAWTFGQYDVYCPRCGAELKDRDEWLAGIADYAASMLIDFLNGFPDLAKQADIYEIPDYAAEGIKANGNIMFNQAATRRVLAECWNEVETAFDDWREANSSDFPVRNIEQLHVFSVAQHAEMIWREIAGDFENDSLTDEDIAEAIERLKRR